MPELPEVELVARALRPRLLGRRIRQVETTTASYFFLTPPAILRRRLPGDSFETLDRIGKYLVATLSSGRRLLLHLGMTGQLILSNVRSPRFVRDAHTHFTVRFADRGPDLFFRDTRQFGKVRLLEPGECEPRLAKLGPDALGLVADVLFWPSRQRRSKVKTLLLDQTVTAGVGNIYADESLFLAEIHPERPAQSLSAQDCAKLARTVRRVLRRSIRAGGSSIDDYIHPDGTDGGFQKQFLVYGRWGEPCFRCNTPIERVVIGQRSSHYCPTCQK